MGNYSNDPQAALEDAVQKGYTNVRFQQGKPILDRELNLASDLAAPRRLFQKYLGNGTPEGSDGFRIDNFNLNAGDFTIKAGSFLVNGYEVVLDEDTTYKNQPHNEHVGPLPQTNNILIYLRVFTVEVNETEDADLHNSGDIGFETALRERVDWEVIVTSEEVPDPDHALLTTLFVGSGSGSVIGKDQRVRGLSLAKVRADLDRLMNPERTELADAIVTSDKLGNSSVGFVKLATQPLFEFNATIANGETVSLLVAFRGSVTPLILLDIKSEDNVSWTESVNSGNRFVLITNRLALGSARVTMKSSRLLNS